MFRSRTRGPGGAFPIRLTAAFRPRNRSPAGGGRALGAGGRLAQNRTPPHPPVRGGARRVQAGRLVQGGVGGQMQQGMKPGLRGLEAGQAGRDGVNRREIAATQEIAHSGQRQGTHIVTHR